MNKLKVALVIGGAAVVAGYVYRKPLATVASRYTDMAHGFVNDLIEEAKQKQHTNQLLKENASGWSYNEDPEADPVPPRTSAQ